MHEHLTAEISASAVAENLSLIRGRLAPSTKFCAVVKADCYGLGVELLLETIVRGADSLAVAAPAEAVRIRDLGYGGPLLMFFSCSAYAGGERREAIEELIRRRVTLTVASADDIEPIAQAARGMGAAAEIHVKVDSGMGRSGVPAGRALATAEAVRAAAGLSLTGMYTQFATAGDPDASYMHEQLRRFREAAEAVPDRAQLVLHAANSAATISAPRTHLDMVRCGLAVYGYQPADRPARPIPGVAGDGEPVDPLPLRPALRVWGRLLAVKELPAGASVGYGRTYTLPRAGTVGLVPVGYADGYFRSLSGRSTMRVAGRDAPVIWRISMDQTIIDLTDAPGAKAGDAVEIISADPAAPHSVENLARLVGTIPYEIICRLGPRVRRVLVP
jgi:alanine racemase